MTSNPVALLVKRMQSLAALASHKEPAISEALIDGFIQIERLTRELAVSEQKWRDEGDAYIDAKDENDRLRSILKVKDETIFALQSDVVRYGDENRRLTRELERLIGECPPVETAAAPRLRVRVTPRSKEVYDALVKFQQVGELADIELAPPPVETTAHPPRESDWHCTHCGRDNDPAETHCVHCEWSRRHTVAGVLHERDCGGHPCRCGAVKTSGDQT